MVYYVYAYITFSVDNDSTLEDLWVKCKGFEKSLKRKHRADPVTLYSGEKAGADSGLLEGGGIWPDVRGMLKGPGNFGIFSFPHFLETVGYV